MSEKIIFAKLTFSCFICDAKQIIDFSKTKHKHDYNCHCKAQYWINYKKAIVKYVRGGSKPKMETFEIKVTGIQK